MNYSDLLDPRIAVLSAKELLAEHEAMKTWKRMRSAPSTLGLARVEQPSVQQPR